MDTLIIGNKGTRIKIQKNSFTTFGGQDVEGLIQIQLKEFYTIEDFIANRLSTNSIDGRILISSGMLFIQATLDGNNLKIKENKPMTLMFKRMHDASVVNLFSGEKGPNDEIRWKTLEPVFKDTISIVTESVFFRDDARDYINLNVEILVGNDTIKPTDSNQELFEKIKDRYRLERELDRDSMNTQGSQPNYSSDTDRLYIFETTELRYINCDIFINDALYPFTVKLDNDKSDVYLILDSMNSLLYPDSISSKTNEYIFNIPDSISVSIVAYRKINDKHFFKIERIESDFQHITIQLMEAPLDKIRDQIKSIGRKSS